MPLGFPDGKEPMFVKGPMSMSWSEMVSGDVVPPQKASESQKQGLDAGVMHCLVQM